MILEFDKSAKTTEAMVRSLMESVQRALEEKSGDTVINQQAIIDKAVAEAKLAIYPVGAIYTSISNTNPETLFGGTWVSFGAGKTIVGVDINDTDFDTVEETGGEKTHTLTINEIPFHSHNIKGGWGAGSMGDGYFRADGNNPATRWAGTDGTGGGQPHSNLQPYITVYMWKRTA